MRRLTSIAAKLALLLGIVLAIAAALSWELAGPMIEPANHRVAAPDERLGGHAVSFASESGAQIAGWLVPGTPGAGAVILLHGVRADRSGMYRRARFLAAAGYTVLLFDFQAHGESAGAYITFGHLESRDATAAVAFLRSAAPHERIGVIGLSMGAAAALLAEPPLRVDALVLEESFPTIDEALADRLRQQYGDYGGALVPLFTWQMPLRIGIGPDALRPIDHIGALRAPKLLIAGAQDRNTTLAESNRLFEAAADPKEYWVVADAGHEDIRERHAAEYEPRVLAFLARWLRADQGRADQGRPDQGSATAR